MALNNEVAVGLTKKTLHPRHGIHEPREDTPDLPSGAIRRVSTIDSTRPGNILGDVVQFGRSQDIRVGPAQEPIVLGEAQVETRLAFLKNFQLEEIKAEPNPDGLQDLVGNSVSTGFRAAVKKSLPEQVEGATLLHLLLDDLPGAALVSGFAIGAADAFGDLPKGPSLQIEGLCAGFVAGGTIMADMDSGNHPPVVTGPDAPMLPAPISQTMPSRQLRAHDVRRHRRLDLLPGPNPSSPVSVEVYFRDSHLDPAGRETVIHEYTIAIRIDLMSGRVLTSTSRAHTLPWVECINAVESANRLDGRALKDLRVAVRQELVGVTTCTHLNDAMRSVEDVRVLLPIL